MELETSGIKLLVDPYFTDNPAAAVSADQVQADFINESRQMHPAAHDFARAPRIDDVTHAKRMAPSASLSTARNGPRTVGFGFSERRPGACPALHLSFA